MKTGGLNIRKTARVAFYAAATGMLIVLLGFIGKEFDNIVCSDVEIVVDQHSTDCILMASDVERFLGSILDSLSGRPVADIDMYALESKVKSDPRVRDADFYFTINGHLRAEIKQRQPVLRIFSQESGSFYLDEEGIVIPARAGFPARVIPANGHIRGGVKPGDCIIPQVQEADTEAKSLLRDLLQLAISLRSSTLLNAQIDQIYVDEGRNIILIPRIGNHIVEFGKPGDTEWKLRKLEMLYRDGFNAADWTRYQKISLKYKNQVVCTKR